ncbi:MAG: MATE family efflux transporter [Alphaproteobacteria bacterium]|nr:MATE family efflux transporter [Alphaproteobacteria bacterium]
MTIDRKNLLEGGVAPHLRRLVLPVMLGTLAIEAFRIIDTLYISRLGTSALAALGFVMPVVMFFMGIIYGLSIGNMSVLSRVFGEGDFNKVRRLATDSFVLTVVFVFVFAITGYFLIDPIFRLMGAEGETLQMIHHYMIVWYCGMIFLSIVMIGNSCIRATGDTRIPSIIMTSAAVINICLDPFLIFGWGIFPKMGFQGAALSQIATYSLMSAVSLYFLIFRKRLLMSVLFHRGSVESWKRILHVGFPFIISNLLVPLALAVITWIAAGLGKEAVAALGVSMRIESISVMIFFSLGASVLIFTGQNFGAGNYGRVSEIRNIAAKYAQIWGFMIAVVLWIFAERISLFFNDDPLVFSLVVQYLRIVPISYVAFGILVIYNAALIGMGRPLPAVFLNLLRAFALYVPMAWIAGKYYGFTGILLALALTNVIIGIISHLWNKKAIS